MISRIESFAKKAIGLGYLAGKLARVPFYLTRMAIEDYKEERRERKRIKEEKYVLTPMGKEVIERLGFKGIEEEPEIRERAVEPTSKVGL